MITQNEYTAVISIVMSLLIGGPTSAFAQQKTAVEIIQSKEPDAVQASDEAIRELTTVEAAIRSYERAFNSHSASRVIEHWMPDGVFERPGQEVVLSGAAKIEAEFKTIFRKYPTLKLKLRTETIEYLGPNVAVERGVSVSMVEGGDIGESQYEAVFVKRGNDWLLDRVSDAEPILIAPASLKLQELEFMVGDWSDRGDDYRVIYRCNWTQKQSYLCSKFHVIKADGSESSGLQMIGWDPVEKQVKSWTFESDGSVGTGRWEQRDGVWNVQVVETLATGRKGSHMVTIRPSAEGGYGWKKTNRVVDGKPMPNIPEVIIRPLVEEDPEVEGVEILDGASDVINAAPAVKTGGNQ